MLRSKYAVERKRKAEFIFRYKVRANVVCNMVKQYLDKSENLAFLDFGSADGLTLIELNSLLPNNRFTGIEYAEELIRQAPALPNNIRLVQGDAAKLDNKIKDARFDVVCALAFLERIPTPVDAVREAARVLRPGGIFIATCPDPFWERVSTFLGLLKAGQHEVAMSRRKLIDAVRRAGLELITFDRFMWAPVSIFSYIGLSLSPSFALKLDRAVRALFVFNMLFVNQCVVARRPAE